MAKILITVGWSFLALAVFVIAYPVFSTDIEFDPLINALPTGILIALGSQLLSQGKNIRDADERRSLFYLESCVHAYEEASKLLQDGNNERAKWIAAGRALAHAKELAESVTEDKHLCVLELHRLKYRPIFYDALVDKSASFFYGSQDPSIEIDEAARASTQREGNGKRTVISTLKELSEKSLRAVWEAAQWPTDYKDPIAAGFTDEEKGKLFVLFPGLHEFLEHGARYYSASGQLHPRDNAK